MHCYRRRCKRNIKPFHSFKRKKSDNKLFLKDDDDDAQVQNSQESRIVNYDFWNYMKARFILFLKYPLCILKFIISIPIRLKLTTDSSLRNEIDDMKNRISYLEITIEKLQRESSQHINNNVTVAMQQCCNYYHSSSSDVQSMPAPPPPLPPPPPPPPPPLLPPTSLQLPPYMSTPISKKKDEEKKDKDLKFAKLHAVTLEELKSVKLRKTGSFLKLSPSCNPIEVNEEINNHHLTTPKLKLNLCNISNSHNGNINKSVTQNKEERKNLNFRTALKQLNINKSPGGTPMIQNTQYGDSFTPPAIQVARKLMNYRGLLSASKKDCKENATDTFEILKF